jgi:aminoglycoside/choline kinase family phosphotransferase
MINSSGIDGEGRLAALTDWLRSIDGLAGADPQPASGDASFRRYFRLHSEQESFIAMDAPPEQEDCKPFIRVAGYLEAMQLNAPRVLEANLNDGFLLLTDLGTVRFLEYLQSEPDAAVALYDDALHALHLMQDHGTAFQSLLPKYDSAMLGFELSLFHDWLCHKHIGIEFSDEDELHWQQLCDLLVSNALDQPQVFVHRDYHSRNLMVTDQTNPGILDFQDAVEGPLTYDLASLLKDCYVKWPQTQVADWALSFYSSTDASIQSQVDEQQFMHYFDLMGVQRHLKAAGIFARLNHRDGKPGYMDDVPRTLSYIVELGSRIDELGFLVELINERCVSALLERS